MTHVPQILHIAHKVAFGVDDLVDRFLPLALLVRDPRSNFRRNTMNPERPRFLNE